MNREIVIHETKNLKLTNALSIQIDSETSESVDVEVMKLDNYIKAKGSIPMGPLVQKVISYNIDDEKYAVKMLIMRQANDFIQNIDFPYSMDPIFRVRDCLYARFIGEEANIRYAYDKLNVYAYEHNIELGEDVYTILVAKDNEEDTCTVDIFITKKQS